MAHKLAIESDLVTAEAVEAMTFQEMSAQYQVRGVPKIVINDEASFEGNLTEEMFMDQVLETIR
ncbi:uncharacterized protein METZ01_LOCUS260223 [marine metagenome]|uniref:Thioredoxin-like fold domain-containing protein n=1 Tax=marine metagenome TaxID=408172 RepID=A0A382J6Y2_9ZZZZ